MAEKVTIMVLKVDLQCPCCYKKVKKILCKFPQIRDQVYNGKANTVTITVVCCDPEKLRDKLCCKGAKVIKSIEIKKPEPPPKKQSPPPRKEKEKPQRQFSPEKPKDDRKPTGEMIRVSVPNSPPVVPPVRTCCGPCSEGYGGGPCYSGYGVAPPQCSPKKPKDDTKPPQVLIPVPVPTLPPALPVVPPVRTCCGPCSEGYGGGPCYFGYGVAPPQCSPKKPKVDPKPPPEMIRVPLPTSPPVVPPVRTCCGPCSEGYGGGPCYFGYGAAPPPPPRRFECHCGYGYSGRPCHVTRCDYYFCEEKPQDCTIM